MQAWAAFQDMTQDGDNVTNITEQSNMTQDGDNVNNITEQRVSGLSKWRPVRFP